MPKTTLMTNSNIDLDLFLCTEILKLESLHFGYWEEDEELSLPNVRKAQARFTSKLIELIPDKVETILDVGCGIGDVAIALSAKNYLVTAISPDKNHKKYFDRLDNDKIIFHQSRFEDFTSGIKYDLILMSESQNYFETDIGFHQTIQFLKKGGYLLVSGIFKKQKSDKFERTINITSDYLEKANKNGFILKESIDISENILPNLYFADQVFNDYVHPTFEMIKHYINTISQVKMFFLKLFFLKQVKQFKEAEEYYKERFSSSNFKKYAEYMTFLFQLG